MTTAMTPAHDRPAERGQAAIEFAIVFLLFFAMLWGILTFGFIFAAQNTLTMAAENGARAALRYQPATSAAGATAARIAAATTVATNTVQWLQAFTPAYDPAAYLTVTSAPCTYNANLICFHVQIGYPYAQHPLIPPFPVFGLLAPTQLVGKATMQVDPGNLLPGG
ncbi:MAG: TadE/TadG family type IV pilus assembly protein [Acidithiobacillus ferrivorans]